MTSNPIADVAFTFTSPFTQEETKAKSALHAKINKLKNEVFPLRIMCSAAIALPCIGFFTRVRIAPLALLAGLVLAPTLPLCLETAENLYQAFDDLEKVNSEALEKVKSLLTQEEIKAENESDEKINKLERIELALRLVIITSVAIQCLGCASHLSSNSKIPAWIFLASLVPAAGMHLRAQAKTDLDQALKNHDEIILGISKRLGIDYSGLLAAQLE